MKNNLKISEIKNKIELDEFYLDKANCCRAGERQIYINEKGIAYPCPNLEYREYRIIDLVSENFSDGILDRIKEVSDKLEKVRCINIERCKNCDYSLFCFKCPMEVRESIYREGMFEHNCNIYKKKLIELNKKKNIIKGI